MRLVPVDLSTYYRKTKNYYILEAFVNSGLEAAMIEGYPQKTAKIAQTTLIASAKRFGFNVKVITRGDEVILIKAKPDEM